MSFIAHLYHSLWSAGFVTSAVIFDLTVLLIFGYVIVNVAIPAFRIYKTVTYLEKAAGPTKKHWFFGHSTEFPPGQEGLLKRCQLTSTHPTMFQSWFGPWITAISLHHSDVAIPLLSSGGPKPELAYGFMRPWIGDGLVTSKGKKWQRNRHLLTPAFHFNILKGYAKIANETVAIMLDKWEKNVNQPLDVSADVSLMTLDTMLKCAMSSETDCQHVKNGHSYIKAVRDIAQLFRKRMSSPLLFPDFIFWRTSTGKELKQCLNVVHSHAEKVIAERRLTLQNPTAPQQTDRSGDENFPYKSRKMLDFLDILIQTKDEDGKGLTDREIRDEVDTFLFAGHDTTSSGISWALYNLAKHPDMQEKCRNEVKEMIGENHVVHWNDLNKLTYLTMFIKESMRIYSPVSGTGRKLEEPLVVRSNLNRQYETVIPKGTTVFLSIFVLHRNELVWEKPLEFNPERFTKENIAKRPPHAYLPFSAGSRNCIGQNFAMNEMKIALAQTLQRYRLYLDEETPEPIMESRFTLQSKDGIHVKLERLPQ